MMLPERPIVVQPTEGPPAPRPHGAAPESTEGETVTLSADGTSQHTDYDRNPLKVAGLDHYLAPPEGAERFKIGG